MCIALFHERGGGGGKVVDSKFLLSINWSVTLTCPLRAKSSHFTCSHRALLSSHSIFSRMSPVENTHTHSRFFFFVFSRSTYAYKLFWKWMVWFLCSIMLKSFSTNVIVHLTLFQWWLLFPFRLYIFSCQRLHNCPIKANLSQSTKFILCAIFFPVLCVYVCVCVSFTCDGFQYFWMLSCVSVPASVMRCDVLVFVRRNFFCGFSNTLLLVRPVRHT